MCFKINLKRGVGHLECYEVLTGSAIAVRLIDKQNALRAIFFVIYKFNKNILGVYVVETPNKVRCINYLSVLRCESIVELTRVMIRNDNSADETKKILLFLKLYFFIISLINLLFFTL